jgi:hypothetical protein
MSSGDSDATLLATIFGGGQDDPSAHLRNLFYFLAVCAVEPLYVASGFALYLNRRTALEAWDIELGFRRIPRATGATVRNLVAMLAAAVLLCTLGASPTPAWAGESKDAARTVIREVLAGPEFQEFREKRVWQARDAAPGQREPGSRALSAELLMRIAEALSQLSRIAAYVIIGAATLALALYLLRSLRNGSASERTRLHERHAPPQTLFGLDVRPESLPADLANVAARLAAQDPRSALSLLYRGALATLMHRDGLAIGNGDTEGDCLRRVHTTHRAELAAYFARLVGAWSQTAYAGRAPDAASVAGLCTDWSRHFAAASGSNAR